MAWIIYVFLFLVFLLSGAYLPWWFFLVPVLISGYFMPSAKRSAWFGFLLGFILWGSLALYRDMMTSARLSHRLADLFGLPNAFLVVLLTGFIAGILCMLASLSGYFFRSTLRSSNPDIMLSQNWRE